MSSNTLGEETDLPAECEAAAFSTACTTKRTRSPSLENPIPPKRFQPDRAEQQALAHISTPQQGKAAQDTTFRTPDMNENKQKPNNFNYGVSPLVTPDMHFQPSNQYQHHGFDPRYPQPQRPSMGHPGMQFGSSQDTFQLMGPGPPQLPPPVLHARQGWSNYEDPQATFMRRDIRGGSEMVPMYQRQAVNEQATVYHSGGGRQHSVVDLTSPVGGQRFFSAMATGHAPPSHSQYQAHRPPSDQHYPGRGNEVYNQSRANAHQVTYNEGPGTSIFEVPYHRQEVPAVRGPLGSPAFGNRSHQRKVSSMNSMSKPAPAHLRQQPGYSNPEIDDVNQQAQERSRSRFRSASLQTPVITRDTPDQREIQRGPRQERFFHNVQNDSLMSDDEEDETLVQIMRRGRLTAAAAAAQNSQPATKEDLPTGKSTIPNNDPTVSAFEEGPNGGKPARLGAKTIQKAREDEVKAQRSAAEKIMQLEQQGRELDEIDDIFEESVVVKASEARIQKSIEEDAHRRHRKEEDQLAKNIKDQYLEQLADLRKKRELEERQARRAEKKSKISDEEKRLAKEKETERIERKRLAAEEMLEKARNQRREAALDETLKKLEVERGAAKKQATSLRPARRNDTLQNLSDEISGEAMESDGGMFINSDDELPPTSAIGKSNLRDVKNDNGKSDKWSRGDGMIAAAELTVATLDSTKMAAIASDDRRRPPPARQFQGGSFPLRNRARRAQDNGAADRKLEASLNSTPQEVEKLLADIKAAEEGKNREWQARFNQIDELAKVLGNTVEVIKQQLPRAAVLSEGKIHASDAQLGFSTKASGVATSLTSQVKLVSEVESETKQREESEKAEREKNEKAKQKYFQRTEREMRRILIRQGVEVNEEKMKQIMGERMAMYEEKKRKKNLKEIANRNDSSKVLEKNEVVISSNEVIDASSAKSRPSGEGDEKEMDEEEMQAKKREEAVRAGLNYLRAKNSAGDGFDVAASKSLIQDLESEDSEEDPDDEDEPEAPLEATPNTQNLAMERHDWPSMKAPSTGPSDENDEIVHPISSIPDEATAVSLPAIINPDEKDLMYIYHVNHRSQRGDNVFETLTLATSHNLEDANAFAQQKINELFFNTNLSLIARMESYDEENRYIGVAANDKLENHSEKVWVSRAIEYIGNVSNLSMSDLKPTKPRKVFNVLRTSYRKGADNHEASLKFEVVATTTARDLANQKALDLILKLGKPRGADIDQVQEYHRVTIPAVRARLAEVDLKGECFGVESEENESGFWFKVEVVECDVVGPIN